MALPLAHAALATGLVKTKTWKTWLLVCLLAVCPDFDFLLVVFFGWTFSAAHRTVAHSLFAALIVTLGFSAFAQMRLKGGRRPQWWLPPAAAVFAAVASHGVLDLLCTADAADHGVMIFWPLSQTRFGWPVLVPFYRLVGNSPFSVEGFLSFTVLEMSLAGPLWLFGRMTASALQALGRRRFIGAALESEPLVSADSDS